MPFNHSRPPLNPTVEEARDETENNNDSTASDFRDSWPEICAQHESVLSSHLRMLQSLKGPITSDAEASKLLSSMVERTNKLCLQYENIKRLIIPRTTGGSDTVRPVAGDEHDSRSHTTSGHDDVSRNKRRKRQRLSNNDAEQEPGLSEPAIAETQSSKRKRVDIPIPDADAEVRSAIPVALETEDISEEVQRRLKIKEVHRRKHDARPEKRKRDRDSLASNGSTSSRGGTTKPRKKFKLNEHVKR
ncbi:hypothetical protein BDW59DRAFT_142263 [Aspergillus cavernicola]|uniref:Uncharacterized protein n=1 Tax=Aspergillus cavernicola TaxID=176166 RepID=A0ABR4INJ3_9EURO